MKLLRKEYPKVREYVKNGHTYYQVDLRRKHYLGPKQKNYTKKEDALTFARDVGSKVARKGLDSIGVQDDPRVKTWTDQCGMYRKTVEDAIAFALGHWEKERKVKASPTMPMMFEKWRVAKFTSTLKPLRERTLTTIQATSKKFARDFAENRLADFNRKFVEQYLEKIDGSNQYRKNLKNYLGQFFNWAKENGLCDSNPCEGIIISVTNGSPKFYKVEQVKKMLEIGSKKENRKMLPYFALGLFAGIRPDEIERMTWENINLDAKEIHLPAAITKTKKERLFQISDNLHSILKSCEDITPLIPKDIDPKRLRVRISKQLGFKWLPDGMRHTFATYQYAKQKSFELLRYNMGNSPSVIDKFYKGAISSTEVDKFWSLGL